MPRLATRADLPGIAAVDAAAFAGSPYPPFFFHQALDACPSLLWVSGSPVDGYALGAPGEAGTWLLSIATHPDARGTGRGRRLLSAFLDAARGPVWLTVAPDNPARALYTRAGFVDVDVDPEPVGVGAPRVRRRRPRG